MPGSARRLVALAGLLALLTATTWAAESDCSDGTDNDGDGRIDCNDPDCFWGPPCPPETDCINGIDDDLDRRIDCQDLDCLGASACLGVENCVDGPDNDGDVDWDCRDTDCAADPGCTGFEICDNGLDDDDDGLQDCAEPTCFRFPGCVEDACSDGIDNERDGLADCFDINCCICLCCGASPRCLPPGESCADSADNDFDGLIDCADPDCSAHPACLGESDCGNGLDDDGDGATDCVDDDCLLDPACAGFDHDGDGRLNSADCAPADDQTWETPAAIPLDATVTKPAANARIGWSSLASQAGTATSYDVLTGEIGRLRVDRSITRAACLAEDVAGTMLFDTRILDRPSDGYYYLIRGRNDCGLGSYGNGSASAPGRVPAADCL